MNLIHIIVLGIQKSFLEQTAIRKILWISLLGLTVAILFSPVSIQPHYPLPMQSIYIFTDFPLFSTLFYSWMFLLLLLAFSGRDNKLESLVLSLVFVLVFLGFWTLITPGGRAGDELVVRSDIRLLQEEGKIPLVERKGGYLDFPGTQLLNFILAAISGLEINVIRNLFLVMNALLFAIFLFVTFLRLLRKSGYALYAVILTITSSILIGTAMNNFHPIALATTFLAFFAFLLSKADDYLLGNWQYMLIFVILSATATIEYLPTSFIFFSILFTVYIICRLFKERPHVSPEAIILPLIFIIAWEIYWAIHSFNTIVGFWPKILEDLREGRFFVATSQALGENIGPAYPWWGNVTRFFWWLFVFGFGSFLMLWKIQRFKSLGRLERIWIGGFLGSVLVCLLGAIGTVGAVHGGFSRILWLTPFYIVPGIVGFLSTKKFSFPFLFLTLLIFTYPTFLTNQDTICLSYVYPQEHSAGLFLEEIYGKGEELKIYGDNYFSFYYVAHAQRFYFPGVYGSSEQEFWKGAYGILADFRQSKPPSLFTITEGLEFSVPWTYLGIPPNHPNWKEIRSELSTTNKVYDSKFMQMFSP